MNRFRNQQFYMKQMAVYSNTEIIKQDFFVLTGYPISLERCNTGLTPFMLLMAWGQNSSCSFGISWKQFSMQPGIRGKKWQVLQMLNPTAKPGQQCYHSSEITNMNGETSAHNLGSTQFRLQQY